ncbi:hypothetical protein P5E51_16210, partial [Clostridium perfringens]|nr:hypothetical protein [Clostridium perfringens]
MIELIEMSAPIESAEEELSKSPNLELSQFLHRYERSILEKRSDIATELQTKILEIIEKDEMAPFYRHLVEKYNWEMDKELENRLKEKNQ